MRGLIVAAILGGAVVGCSPGQQEQVATETRAAYDTTAKKVTEAWNSLNDQASRLDPGSAKSELESMKQKLQATESQATKAGQKQLEAVQDQWNRLDLAEKVQDLQVDAKQKLDDMNKARSEAGKGLDEANKAYAATEEKLAEAQKAYEEATKRTENAWNALTGH